MIRTRMTRLLIPAGMAVLTALLLGCNGTSGVASGPTALGTLPAAQSALATAAPDARLLVVQTASSVTATGTPVWVYLFGDPETDKTYLVYASDGQSMGAAQEYGTAGLSEAEWKDVPDTYTWKVDSDDAYTKALAASGATGDPAGYMMGLMTYKSSADTSTVEPLVWNVWFDPGPSGATQSTVLVDAQSGDASIAESEAP